MSYTTSLITDEKTWEAFVLARAPHTFLQAWKWGSQYEANDNQVFRLGVFKKEEVIGVGLLIHIKARRGSFLLCPHGPLVEDEPALAAFTKGAVEIAKQQRCDFIRFCPLHEDTPTHCGWFKKLGFRPAPIHMHPELSWMLDITKSEDQLLMEMRKTTRYLIKRSEKDGVSISMSTDPADIKLFWPIYQETAARQHFTPFSKKYLEEEFKLFAADNQIAFFFAHYQGEVISVAIIVFYGESAFYHHSGSTNKFEKVNASYLLQWRAIQEAKKRGCTLYNFWGIAPEDKPKHPWAGLSLFKKGFGGFAEAYVHAQDYPLTPKYTLNAAVETVRRIRRGL